MQPEIPIRELTRLDVAALQAHFLALGPHDRRLRFGVPLGDSAVTAYVLRIDFERDAVFGVFDDELRLTGVGHLARDAGHAELGVSVLAECRGRGQGGALLGRAHMHARNWGVRGLFMHCLTENSTMMYLARRQGMQIVSACGEADAWLKLPPADAASHFAEVFAQRVALFDYACKSQLAGARRIADALTRGRALPAPGK